MGNIPVFLIKGRKVGNSIVLTAPKSTENKYYTVSLLPDGTVKYTPLQPRHDGSKCQDMNNFDEVVEDV